MRTKAHQLRTDDRDGCTGWRAQATALALLAFMGCSGPEPAGPGGGNIPGTGVLQLFIPRDAFFLEVFTVNVDGEDVPLIVPDNFTTLSAVPAGDHSLEFVDPPSECVVVDGTSRTVSLAAGDTVSVFFGLLCTANLRIRTATTGTDQDRDDYIVSLVDSATQNIGLNAERGWDRLLPGDYGLELLDVAANCTVGGENPRTVTMVPIDTVVTVFNVSCITPPLPPPTGRIVYHGTTSTTIAGPTDIFRLDVATGEVTQLTNDTDWNLHPELSPDGSKYLFSKTASRFLMTMLADGTGAQQIGTVQGVFNPTWAPDGTRIAFATTPPAGFERSDIFVVDVDGSNLTNLTSGLTGKHAWPDWSPDGQKIAFTSTQFGRFSIFTMNPDGTDVTQIVDGSAGDARYPAWSSDGTKIAFGRNEIAFGRQEIFVANADGTDIRRVTLNRNSTEGISWSPDGSRLAYLASAGSKVSLFYANAADGTGQVQLSSDDTFDLDPSWSP